MKKKHDSHTPCLAWRTDTPPQEQCFLANVGLPFVVMCQWNEAEKLWAYASLQANLYHGTWDDFTFETEYAKEVLGWLELPDVGASC